LNAHLAVSFSVPPLAINKLLASLPGNALRVWGGAVSLDEVERAI
jgi:hypothetical protein